MDLFCQKYIINGILTNKTFNGSFCEHFLKCLIKTKNVSNCADIIMKKKLKNEKKVFIFNIYKNNSVIISKPV